jgi:AcrR family transcriptional regulator
VTTTRERALGAALELVGEQGIRALVHARVDERAGLPKGSTSNWFRTRDALVAGVIGWIAERERDDFHAGAAPAVTTPDQLIDAFSGLISAETDLFAGRTRARYALFLEGANDPLVLKPLLQQRAVYVEWATDLLAGRPAGRCCAGAYGRLGGARPASAHGGSRRAGAAGRRAHCPRLPGLIRAESRTIRGRHSATLLCTGEFPAPRPIYTLKTN